MNTSVRGIIGNTVYLYMHGERVAVECSISNKSKKDLLEHGGVKEYTSFDEMMDDDNFSFEQVLKELNLRK